MKVKTFHARSLPEALAQVKRSLTGEAVILYTKSVRAPGLMGFFGRQVVEVAAATDVPRRSEEAAPAAAPAMAAVAAYRKRESGGTDETLGKLREEIAGIRGALDELVKSTVPPSVAGLPEPVMEGYVTLVRHGVTETLAADVARSAAGLADAAAVKDRMTAELASRVKAAGGIETGARRKVVALVGPTGVGKTTTIAKIAAEFKVRRRLRVALITIDTYRIAAVQQLQTIADIIQVPLSTVLTVGDLKESLAALGNCDLVLIDTAGRSQRDELKMADLDAFLNASEADEVHLVISAAAGLANMSEVIERFRPLGPTKLIVTKIDEAEALGRIASVAASSGLGLSYLTTGQDIPNDIELASAERVADMAWER